MYVILTQGRIQKHAAIRFFTYCYSLRSSKTSLIFTLRNGQDDKFAYRIDFGSTVISLLKFKQLLNSLQSYRLFFVFATALILFIIFGCFVL